ncbi:hypothetical protein H7J83_06235 [Mycobacterium mantenii]|uniref:DUF6545 domain-containing protein n=2 Tax=Mycobacterium mantenii TaxID=560555 RepID=A0A1X0FJT8_MYCNT|nr:DUF6545 domain-containing protein [Mycobacterium mantenii]MCV7242344.1 hypothetical protein [Mycobacterium mantenii]ORB01540.1 hypothetical protein BST30_21010 [Mycobacterium mantenii]
MTSTIPGVVAWPVITIMVILLAARFRWCRANLYQTYLNSVMAWLLLAQILREHRVEAALSRSALMTVTTAQQLSCVAMMLACAEFIGFTMLWNRISPEETRRSHRWYRLAAVALSVAFLAAGTRARVAGQTFEASGGWDAVLALSLYLTIIVILVVRLLWMFGSELLRATERGEMLLAAAGVLAVAVTGAACSEALVLAVSDQLGWTHTVKFRHRVHGSEFLWMAVIVYLFGAVSLAVRLHSYLGLDRVSRAWKNLQPLRFSMMVVVPESRFTIEHADRRFQKTTLQLHQTVIEIRDGILQLRHYVRDAPPDALAQFLQAYAVPADERGSATDAFELAHAVRAKAEGVRPQTPDRALVVRSRSTSLYEEAADLLALAKWWAPALAATDLNRVTSDGPGMGTSLPA